MNAPRRLELQVYYGGSAAGQRPRRRGEPSFGANTGHPPLPTSTPFPHPVASAAGGVGPQVQFSEQVPRAWEPRDKPAGLPPAPAMLAAVPPPPPPPPPASAPASSRPPQQVPLHAAPV
ncbi:acrosin-like [Schistocerca americana]|uniref:acrosin-like n=1 Tax=Schistocerca americana TaxID=7009 RepID=UPI001F4FDB61|nr:acrosin-like [Schistocerca americana]